MAESIPLASSAQLSHPFSLPDFSAPAPWQSMGHRKVLGSGQAAPWGYLSCLIADLLPIPLAQQHPLQDCPGHQHPMYLAQSWGMSAVEANSVCAPEAPPGPAWLPLALVWGASCSCFFIPQSFCLQWTSTNSPLLATSILGHSAIALGQPRSCPDKCGPSQHLATYQRSIEEWPTSLGTLLAPTHRVRGAPSPTVLLISITATTAGASPGSHMSQDSHILLKALPKEILWEYSRVRQDDLSSIPMAWSPGAILHGDTGLLSLPVELFSPTAPSPRAATILSLEQLTTGRMEPWRLCWSTRQVPPSPQLAMCTNSSASAEPGKMMEQIPLEGLLRPMEGMR